MPAIIFSKVLSLGEEYDVFSLGKLPECPRKYADRRGQISSVFIIPSIKSDVKIEIPDFYAKTLFSYMPAAISAAKFLLGVRGLPMSEITVETPVGEITVLSGKGGKCAAFLDKFSVTGKGEISLLGESISTFTLKSPFGKIRALKVNRAPDFSQSLLREASLSNNGEGIVGAVAFDDGGFSVYHFSKSGEFPERLTAAVTVAACLYPKEKTVKIGEDIFEFSYLYGKLRVTDNGGKPLTFYAPAID